MMTLEIVSGFGVNSLIWLTSLSPEHQGPTRRIVEDLSPFFKSIGLAFPVYYVKSAAQLYELLDGIAQRCRDGAKPMLHLDMHGSKNGLMMADTREIAPWNVIVPKLRTINIASHGNLCVIASVCFAFHAIKQVQIAEACPVYMLIAPEEEVTFGFLEDNTVKFYQDVFSSTSIDEAYQENFAGYLKVFHCENFLAIAICRYIRQSCRGKNAALRRERLLTEIFLGGRERTPDNLRAVRKQLKDGLRPNQSLVDAYAQTFLVGRHCPFTIDDLLALVDGARNLG